MLSVFLGLLLAASAPAATVPNLAGSHARAEPSFRCAGGLLPTETLICGDAELRAYDRAIAYAYTHKWYPNRSRWASQRQWLTARNKCRSDRPCVLDAYRRRLGDMAGIPDAALSLHRVAERGNEGTLFISPLGEDWYLFSAYATHIYDPHDGVGENMSDAQAAGLVRIMGGRGVFVDDPSSPTPCTVAFEKLPAGRWKLVEKTDSCSGLGASLTGLYGR